jgi:ferredoxin--NADP+ reductase
VTTKKIAVVGAGPAGIYFADAMFRLDPSARIDVLERLPFPYGLVRYGVAADHHGTKNVTKILARAMRRPNVNYFGGVEVGRILSLAELDQIYDAVVLATGASGGRTVEFPADDSYESVSAFDLARWLNGYPGPAPFSRRPLRSAAIIGNGNVALDVVRLLAKPVHELAKLDLSAEGIEWLQSNALEQINVIGRGRAGETRFSVAELEELAHLEYFQPRPEPPDLLEYDGIHNNGALEVLRRFSAAPVRDDARPLGFHFGCAIARYESGALHVLSSGRPLRIPAELVVHAVGQHAGGLTGVGGGAALEGVKHTNGVAWGRDSTFAVGWAAGTGRGTIPDSRASAQAVAQLVAAVPCKARGTEQGASLEELLHARAVTYVSWDAWERIDRSELELGRMNGKSRQKYRTLSECAGALDQSGYHPKPGASIKEPAS